MNLKNITSCSRKLLLSSALLLVGALCMSAGFSARTNTNAASIKPSTYFVTVPLNIPGSGWTQLIHEQGYPNVAGLVQAIQNVAAVMAIVDPPVFADHITFYAYDKKKYSVYDEVLLASEYADSDMIILYNPNSPHVMASKTHATYTMGLAAAATDNSTDRILTHELGHARWKKMTPQQKEAWWEVYEYTKLLDKKRPTNGYVRKDGSTGRYYDDFPVNKDANGNPIPGTEGEEGFCEAFADHYTATDPEVELDTSIKNYLDNLPK